MAKAPAKRITGALLAQPWAITEGYLRIMLDIAARQNLDVETVERQLGRRLDNTQSVTERGGVAIIPVTGPIFRYGNLFSAVSGATSIQGLARDFNVAINNPDIRAILLNIDSPGGEANGVAEFAEMVYQARGRKPIWAYVGGTGASAAYWIASTADKIITHESAMLGSIGVIAAIPTDEEGEVTFVSAQSPRKAMDPETEAGQQDIQYVLDTLAQLFVETVARNRKVEAATVLSDFGQGAVLIGKDAVTAGLADRLGTFEGTLTELSRGREEARREAPALAASLPQINATAGVDPTKAARDVKAALTTALTGAGGRRSDTRLSSKEQVHMAEELDQAPPPEAPPIDTELNAAELAQVERVVQLREREWAAREKLILQEAEARFERRMAEMQAQQAIQSYAQHATTPTLDRPHALPFTAAEVVTLLSETPAGPRAKWQAAMDKILTSGLVSFEEIGSTGEGPAEQSAKEQFDAAVFAKMNTGLSKLAAIQAVGKENPSLYASYQAEARPARTAITPRKGAK